MLRERGSASFLLSFWTSDPLNPPWSRGERETRGHGDGGRGQRAEVRGQRTASGPVGPTARREAEVRDQRSEVSKQKAVGRKAGDEGTRGRGRHGDGGDTGTGETRGRGQRAEGRGRGTIRMRSAECGLRNDENQRGTRGPAARSEGARSPHPIACGVQSSTALPFRITMK